MKLVDTARKQMVNANHRLISSSGNQAKLYVHDNGLAALGDLQKEEDIDELLAQAESLARKQGATRLAAPMNGDTWHSYRTIIEDNGRPQFLLEPSSPLTASMLERNGFHLEATYVSAAIDDLSIFAKPVPPIGLKIRTLKKNEMERELHHIYELSLKSFHANYLYTPISFAQFCELYQPLTPMIEEELVWLAFVGATLVGFVFNLPDFRNHGQVILKTIAVDPQFNGLGIGRHLYDLAHHNFYKEGFQSAVHALFKDDNRSSLLSQKSAATIFRRYGLFIKDLCGADSEYDSRSDRLQQTKVA